MNQKQHEPKRAQTKNSTNKKGPKPKRTRSPWYVPFLLRTFFGLCSFWFVLFLVCALFGRAQTKKRHDSKRAQTKNSASQKQHEQKNARTENSTNQKGTDVTSGKFKEFCNRGRGLSAAKEFVIEGMACQPPSDCKPLLHYKLP